MECVQVEPCGVLADWSVGPIDSRDDLELMVRNEDLFDALHNGQP